jgi:hypothetical protein
LKDHDVANSLTYQLPLSSLDGRGRSFLKIPAEVFPMKRLLTILLVMFVCLSASAALAATSVYPVKGVFGFDAPVLQQKAPTFAKLVSSRGFASLEKEFDTEFRKVFGPLAVDTITDLNKHEVLVASLHLVRASEYVVPKMGNYEVHLPITLSIVITNPSTGEAVYSFTKTSYAAVLLANPNADLQAQKLLLNQTESNYRTLMQTLIKEAKVGYNPTKIEITIADTWKGLYILDKGSKFGIAKDDSIVDSAGNELSVKYVSENYAVAASLLGNVDRSRKFFKYATASTANQFNKPRVLTMHEGWNNPILTEISYFFDSEVATESAFTLLPVNEYFRKLLETVARDTYSGKFETTEQREMPDYLIKFSASAPRLYTISEKGKFALNVYEQYVLGELLDKQGRIIFSAVGSNRIEDKNVGGMVFDKNARLEVVLKNAVVNLAEQFTKSIKYSHFVLPVKNVDGKFVEINDTSRTLRIGQEVTLYRSVGKVSGVSTDVTIPLWQANVVEVQNGNARLELLMPLVDKGVGIATDDMVLIDSMTVSATADHSSTSVTYCSHIAPKLGTLDIDDFSVVSRAFGYLLPYSLYDRDELFSRKIHEAAKFGGFKDTLKLGKINTSGRCLLPVYQASIEKKQCENGNCNFDINLAVGYRLYVNNEKKGGTASKTKISIEDCIQSSQKPVIQEKLSKDSLELLKTNIQTLRY